MAIAFLCGRTDRARADRAAHDRAAHNRATHDRTDRARADRACYSSAWWRALMAADDYGQHRGTWSDGERLNSPYRYASVAQDHRSAGRQPLTVLSPCGAQGLWSAVPVRVSVRSHVRIGAGTRSVWTKAEIPGGVGLTDRDAAPKGSRGEGGEAEGS